MTDVGSSALHVDCALRALWPLEPEVDWPKEDGGHVMLDSLDTVL